MCIKFQILKNNLCDLKGYLMKFMRIALFYYIFIFSGRIIFSRIFLSFLRKLSQLKHFEGVKFLRFYFLMKFQLILIIIQNNKCNEIS
jgi:hypothetical protein